MALTPYQRAICALLAERRREGGDSYIAGGVALNVLTNGSRRSRDVDLFHDTLEAVQFSADADRALLRQRGFTLSPVRERAGFIEELVEKDGERVLLQWVRDSAFRFFPLVEHVELGLTLHPFDLATNKLLALIGRREPRDWVDSVRCDEVVQPLGYLAWAASGKDPGFSPLAVIEEAARASRYSQLELDGLDFDGPTPRAADLSKRWHAAVNNAREQINLLPAEKVGACVLGLNGELLRDEPSRLTERLESGEVRFHFGSIRGAFPEIRPLSR